jgi:hypothetical protein
LLLQKDVLLGELLFIAVFKALTLAVAFGGVFYFFLEKTCVPERIRSNPKKPLMVSGLLESPQKSVNNPIRRFATIRVAVVNIKIL